MIQSKEKDIGLSYDGGSSSNADDLRKQIEEALKSRGSYQGESSAKYGDSRYSLEKGLSKKDIMKKQMKALTD
jgi:hypothetical protein